jgi:hypothetical protein
MLTRGYNKKKLQSCILWQDKYLPLVLKDKNQITQDQRNLIFAHEFLFSSVAHRLIASFLFNCLQQWAHKISVSQQLTSSLVEEVLQLSNTFWFLVSQTFHATTINTGAISLVLLDSMIIKCIIVCRKQSTLRENSLELQNAKKPSFWVRNNHKEFRREACKMSVRIGF